MKESKLLKDLAPYVSNLHEQWSLIPASYPSNYQNLTTLRSRVLLKALASASGCTVIEAGCNSGLFSIGLSFYAKSVLGIDIDQGNVLRSKSTLDFFSSRGLVGCPITFACQDLNSAISENRKFDCLLASLFLYYLHDDELIALREYITQYIKVLIVQCRPRRFELVHGKSGLGNVSNLTIYNGLYTLRDNIDFFVDCGFDEIELIGLDSDASGDEVCPVLIGKR